ncbi:nucleoside triphosphate pyrophosphohydrolase, partial [Mesorhizobium sp. M7A.F.Ca.CA.001.13.2.1]
EEEIGEWREALAKGDTASIKDEFGDMLFAVVNLGRHLKLDSEAALSGTNEKFRSRFHYVEQALEKAGNTLDKADLAEMEALWQEAKTAK